MIAALGTCALGRAIDADALPLDGGAPLRGTRVRVGAVHVPVAQRAPIREPFFTGVRAIDALLTIGRGARIGLFGAPGAGKSSLLRAIALGARADAVVVALVGERGREAEEWMRARAPRQTIVCATSDRPADERIRAADVAFAQAHALRERGLHVLMLLDSLARAAHALREQAVVAGEATGRGGYPPSVFARLARMVEAAGATRNGSITLVATVLDDGDERDPVSDSARSLLDGHIALSGALASAGHFPAIDVVASASRTMGDVVDSRHAARAAVAREALAWLAHTADARALGVAPDDPRSRRVLDAQPALLALLRQGAEPSSSATALTMLARAADTLEG